MSAALQARRIAVALSKVKVSLSSEAAAQRDITAALTASGIEYETEVRLSARDRIDVLCGTIGIEIKVKHSRRDIWHQLLRYAEHDRIEALVLATGRSWPGAADKVGNIPLFIVDLSRGWL